MLALRSCLVVVCLLASPYAASSEEEDHAHEEGGNHSTWEWVGVFTLNEGETYTWSAERVEHEYADAEMQILILPTTEATHEGIESAEGAAEELWEAGATGEVDSGESIPLSTAVALHFDVSSWVSVYKITVNTTGAYAIFAQHLPTEFENNFHYLKDEHGTDVEPGDEEVGGHDEHDDEHSDENAEDEHKDRWGLVIGGSFLTVLPALLLIAVAGPALSKVTAEFLPPLSCFASGAIMAAAVFLMLPEGFLLAGVGQEEVTATWTWGTAVLGGWFFGTLIHMVTDTARHGTANAEQKEELEAGTGIDWSVAVPILFGDFWHNIVDGFVIGFAAKACDASLVWSIIAATAGHEIPQEFGDFVILLSKARMPWYMAMGLNFVSGLSSVVGAIIAYEVDVSSNLEGIALAFGAGVYIFVAATELGPAFLEMTQPSAKQAALRLSFFVLGAVCIGLVLTNHEHCIAASAEGAEGGDDGHGHR